ncbi:MAG TPA: DUF4397 domain-containing protein [Acidobacteriaceae bacterium]|nr:DUF4397 domain-containing protein [Acidobacteriaceae bacterium]
MPVNLENAKRILLATLLTGLCWALPGCQSITPTTTFAEIRFIDAAPTAPGLDFYETGVAVDYNVGFGQVSTYQAISPGTYRFSVNTAGTSQSLVSTLGSVSTGHQYTVLVSTVSTALAETIIPDQSTSAPSGQIAIRVINEATQSGPYDVYMVPSGTPLLDVSPVLTGSSDPSISAYINIPTGTYQIEIVPSGTVLTSTTVATFSSTETVFNSGSAHTFIILDQQIITTPGAQVVTTDDYEPPGSVPGI